MLAQARHLVLILEPLDHNRAKHLGSRVPEEGLKAIDQFQVNGVESNHQSVLAADHVARKHPLSPYIVVMGGSCRETIPAAGIERQSMELATPSWGAVRAEVLLDLGESLNCPDFLHEEVPWLTL